MTDTTATDAAVETLSLAFFDDPVTSWVFEDANVRLAQLRVWWAWMIENRLSHVDVLETPDGHSAAIWHGPDPAADEARNRAFFDMLAGLLGPQLAQQKLEAMAVIPAAHPTERHWYLAAVGTRPDHQGKGSAGRVVQPVLDRCDAAGLPAYLESSNPRNESFYERLGFAATGRIEIPGGPTLTAMWRTARQV
jgi:GNAT superfamily N-acetyltransferase